MEEVVFLFIGIVIVIILIINGVIAKKFETIAEEKGYDKEIHSFAMCFWLGVIGYLYVIALPDRVQVENQEKIYSLLKESISDCSRETTEEKNVNIKNANVDENKKEQNNTLREIEVSKISEENNSIDYQCPVCGALVKYGVANCPNCSQTFAWKQ